jgi:hypothetical protein
VLNVKLLFLDTQHNGRTTDSCLIYGTWHVYFVVVAEVGAK